MKIVLHIYLREFSKSREGTSITSWAQCDNFPQILAQIRQFERLTHSVVPS